MNELNLTTPSLLFSAISLILLAYTNRFLSYASIVRHLKEKYENDPEAETTSLAQIDNLYRRLNLIRAMQILGAGSLLVCLAAMFFYYLEWNLLGGWVYGLARPLALPLHLGDPDLGRGAEPQPSLPQEGDDSLPAPSSR